MGTANRLLAGKGEEKGERMPRIGWVEDADATGPLAEELARVRAAWGGMVPDSKSLPQATGLEPRS
jgi:hypothetical protein